MDSHTRIVVRSARDIFLSALDVAPADRAAFVGRSCHGDATLRAEVEELLAEHERLGGFMEAPAFHDSGSSLGLGIATVTGEVVEKPGDRIDRYKLLQQIGEGGCGIVYMAEQEQPVRRRVALKIIKLGMDTKAVIARFEAERQALAMMDHPNIARVLDAGATETGRPYFVMELVRGVRITEYCDENNLPTTERLRLFILVCNAIQHAHQKGVIHRDIKPSNILVTLHDGVAVPKVIDFGIAKATEQPLTDKTVFTEFHSFIGTPAYMSPEQAMMSGLDIDTRSDVYSLGVLLYELLTGAPPFDPAELTRSGLDECRRTIREQDPARPSTRVSNMAVDARTRTAELRQTDGMHLVHALRGDLDWIVMKCLEKDRTRRYGSSSDLAADVQRYIDGDAILARPPSNVYLVRKFLRRHRGVMAAAAAVAGTLLIGIGVSTWQAVRATTAEHNAEKSQREEAGLRGRAEQERQRAEQESAAARLNEYIADINLVQQSLSAGNYGRAVQLLQKHRPIAGSPDLRGFEWCYLWQESRGNTHTGFPQQESDVSSVAISPSGDLLAVGLHDRFSVWSIPRRTLITSHRRSQQTFGRGGGAGVSVSVAFLPNGRLVTADTSLHVWNTNDWSEEKVISGVFGPVAISHNGARVAASRSPFGVGQARRESGIRIWESGTWTEVAALRDVSAPLALSPDGRFVAANSPRTNGLAVWPVDGASEPVTLTDSANLFVRAAGPFRNDRALAFSPDGKFVVAPRNVPSERGVFVVSVWDAKTGEEIAVFPDNPEYPEHTGSITALAFSPDGEDLATASMDRSIRLWDFQKRQHIGTQQGHLHEVWSIAFAPDGKRIASGAKGGELKLWPAEPKKRDELIESARLPLGISKDGKTLAALNRTGNIIFFDLATGNEEEEIEIDPGRAEFRGRDGFAPGPGGPGRGFGLFSTATIGLSADLNTVAVALPGFGAGRIQIWKRGADETSTITNSSRPVSSLALSPDGRTLVCAMWDRAVRWWDLRQRTNITMEAENIQATTFAADGRTVATLSREGGVWIWDVASRSVRTNIVVDTSPVFPGSSLPLGLSPDGKIVALACQDDAIRLWETASARLIGMLIGHKQEVRTLAFAPDGKTIVTGSDDSTLKFWNVATQQELVTLRRLGGAPRGLMFAPDGSSLVAGSSSVLPSGSMRIFRAPTLAEIDAQEAGDVESLNR